MVLTWAPVEITPFEYEVARANGGTTTYFYVRPDETGATASTYTDAGPFSGTNTYTVSTWGGPGYHRSETSNSVEVTIPSAP